MRSLDCAQLSKFSFNQSDLETNPCKSMIIKAQKIRKVRSFLKPCTRIDRLEWKSLKRPLSFPKLSEYRNSFNDMYEYISDNGVLDAFPQLSELDSLIGNSEIDALTETPCKSILSRHVDFDLNVNVLGEHECKKSKPDDVNDITASDEKSSCEEFTSSRVHRRTKIMKKFRVSEANELSSSSSLVSEAEMSNVQCLTQWNRSRTDVKETRRSPFSNEDYSDVRVKPQNNSHETAHEHKKCDHSDLEDGEECSVTIKSPNDRFIRLQEIGRGAFKTVYKGLDTTDGIAVAWCELQDVYDKSERIRFKEEVKLLKELQHPNIVRFYDYWEYHHRGRRIIVLATELMTSGSLKSYLKNFKSELNPKKLKIIKNWCRQILQGLAYMHSRNPPIIHRDLKCDNIFITGTTGSVKIGDLGLAILKTETFVKSMRGTFEFMAPEMFEEMYDEMVDVYSFGLCMLELVTGEYPYMECRFPTAVMKKVISGQPPDCYYKVQNEAVREIIDCCIRKNKEERLPVKDLLQHSFFAENNGLLVEVHNSEKEARYSAKFIEFKLKVDDPSKRTTSLGQSDALIFRFDTINDVPEKICSELLQNGFILESDVLFITQSIKDRLRTLRFKEIDEKRMKTTQKDETAKSEGTQSHNKPDSSNLQEAAMIAANVASNRFRVVTVSEDDLKDNGNSLTNCGNTVDIIDAPVKKGDNEDGLINPMRANSDGQDAAPKLIKLSHIKRIRINVISVVDTQVKCSFETPGVVIEFLFDHATFKPEIVGSVLISMITKGSSKEEIEKYKIPLTMSCINCLVDIVSAIDSSSDADRSSCIKYYQNDVQLDYKLPSDGQNIESINVKEEYNSSFVVSNMNVDTNYVTDDEMQLKGNTSRDVASEASQFDEQFLDTELQRSNTMPSFINSAANDIIDESRRFSVPQLGVHDVKGSEYQGGSSSAVSLTATNAVLSSIDSTSQKPLKKNYLAELHQLDLSLKQALARPKQEESSTSDSHNFTGDSPTNDSSRNRVDNKNDLNQPVIFSNGPSVDSNILEHKKKPTVHMQDQIFDSTFPTNRTKSTSCDANLTSDKPSDVSCDSSIQVPFVLKAASPQSNDKSVEAKLTDVPERRQVENILIDIAVDNIPPASESCAERRPSVYEMKLQGELSPSFNDVFSDSISTFDGHDPAHDLSAHTLEIHEVNHCSERPRSSFDSSVCNDREFQKYKLPVNFSYDVHPDKSASLISQNPSVSSLPNSNGICFASTSVSGNVSNWLVDNEASVNCGQDSDVTLTSSNEFSVIVCKTSPVATPSNGLHYYNEFDVSSRVRPEVSNDITATTCANTNLKSDMTNTKPSSNETLNILDTMIMQQAQELNLNHGFHSKQPSLSVDVDKLKSFSITENNDGDVFNQKLESKNKYVQRCKSNSLSNVPLPFEVEQNCSLDNNSGRFFKQNADLPDSFKTTARAKEYHIMPNINSNKCSYAKINPCSCELPFKMCDATDEYHQIKWCEMENRASCHDSDVIDRLNLSSEKVSNVCKSVGMNRVCPASAEFAPGCCDAAKICARNCMDIRMPYVSQPCSSTFHEISCNCCKKSYVGLSCTSKSSHKPNVSLGCSSLNKDTNMMDHNCVQNFGDFKPVCPFSAQQCFVPSSMNNRITSPSAWKHNCAINAGTIENLDKSQLVDLVEYQQKVIENLSEERMPGFPKRRLSHPVFINNNDKAYVYASNSANPQFSYPTYCDLHKQHVSNAGNSYSFLTTDTQRAYQNHLASTPLELKCVCAECRTMLSPRQFIQKNVCVCPCSRLMNSNVDFKNVYDKVNPSSLCNSNATPIVKCYACQQINLRTNNFNEHRNLSTKYECHRNMQGCSYGGDENGRLEFQPIKPCRSPSFSNQFRHQKNSLRDPSERSVSYLHRQQMQYTNRRNSDLSQMSSKFYLDIPPEVKSRRAFNLHNGSTAGQNAYQQSELYSKINNTSRPTDERNSIGINSEAVSPASERDDVCDNTWSPNSYLSCHQGFNLLQNFSKMLERHKEEIGAVLFNHHQELISFMQQFNCLMLSSNQLNNSSSANGYYSPNNNEHVVPRTSQTSGNPPVSNISNQMDECVCKGNMQSSYDYILPSEQCNMRIHQQQLLPSERTNSAIR